MGFKEIVSLDADVTIALGGKDKKTGKKNPTEIEGFYLGSRQVKSPKSKSGLAYIHFFQTAAGNVGVWGKTDLDRKLIGVTPGTMTLVAFDKMVPTPNGDMYKYKVAVDEDNTIEVSATVLDNASAASEDTETGEADDSVEQEEDNSAALQRQARVQELLNRGKTNSAKK